MTATGPLSELQARFDEIAADIPDSAAIEQQVEALTNRPRRNRGHLLATAAVLAVVVGGLITLTAISGADSESVEVAVVASTGSSGAADPPFGSTFTSTRFAEPIQFGLPDLPGGTWMVTAESEWEIELRAVLNTATNDMVVRLLTIPGASADDVVDRLLASLFDTDVISTRPTTIGRATGTEVELASRRGTSHAAFGLGTNTYVETTGVNRRYLIRAVDRPSGAFVVWMDANDEDFAGARYEVDQLARSISFE